MMNLKALVTTAMLVVGSSSAAFAAPRVEVVHDRAPVAVRVDQRQRVDHRVAVRPIVERPIVERPIVERPIVERPIVERPIVRHPVAIHPVWHPVIRPIFRPVIVGAYSPTFTVGTDGFITVGSFDVAFDGTQNIDLGAGRSIETLRVAGDANTEIYSVGVTYADGETQTITCDQVGSFETNLGGNVVTNLTVTARNASSAPLLIQVA